MLILTRTVNERIVIGTSVVVTVIDIGRGQIRLGIDAPLSVKILREELVPRRPTRSRLGVSESETVVADPLTHTRN